MWSWILVVVLYLLSIWFSRLLGGLGGAADALERWGNSRARKWAERRTASS